MKRAIVLAIVAIDLALTPHASLGDYVAVQQEKIFTSDGVIQDGDVYTSVRVYDTPPSHTIVNMTGGAVGENSDAESGLYTYDSSTVNITGGSAQFLHTNDSSVVNISGGTVGNWYLGGRVSVSGNGSSTINLYEGGIITGGTFNFFDLYDSSTLNVYGGDVGIFFAVGHNATLNMYAGSIFDLSIFGTANIYGGTVNSWDLFSMSDNARLNVYGSEFDYTAHWSYEGRWISRLTGTGLDGVAIDIRDIPDPYTTQNINFIPEPTALTFLAFGALAITRWPASRKDSSQSKGGTECHGRKHV